MSVRIHKVQQRRRSSEEGSLVGIIDCSGKKFMTNLVSTSGLSCRLLISAVNQHSKRGGVYSGAVVCVCSVRH